MKTLISRLHSKRSGLVLAGGGAKGAFQAGALTAFLDLGLTKFEVVAGTSVGALNAALFQQACIHTNEGILTDMWTDMRLSRVMGWTRMALLQLLMAILYSLQMAIFFRTPRNPSQDSDIDVVLIHGVGWAVLTFCGFVLFTALMFLAKFFELQLVEIVGLLIALAIFTQFIDWLLTTVLGVTPSMASNRPMQEKIATLDVDRIAQGHPSIICTLGHNVSLGPPIARTLQGAIFPVYFPLAAMTAEEASEVLLLSAALPHIFPSRRVRGRWYVDGGLVDNVPLLGAFMHDQIRPVDAILTIYLSVGATADRDERSRCMRLAANALGGVEGMPVIRVLLEHWFQNAEFHAIRPHSDLRGFFGTIDFRQSRARTLMEMGYAAALDQIVAIAAAEGDATT